MHIPAKTINPDVCLIARHKGRYVALAALTEDWRAARVGRVNGSPDNDWPWFGVYLYRADGTYTRAKWAKTREEFVNLLPKIASRVKRGLEVAITNTGDEMLFHARGGVVEWDGIELEPLLERYQDARK